jgi:hypothetical protein
MQGMRFLILFENGPVNNGIITQQITPEKYLCTFFRKPQSSRVVDIAEIQQWNLFPNDDGLNAFLKEVNTQQEPSAPPAPPAPKPQAKKKADKKSK